MFLEMLDRCVFGRIVGVLKGENWLKPRGTSQNSQKKFFVATQTKKFEMLEMATGPMGLGGLKYDVGHTPIRTRRRTRKD
jgi:hypothetical protein